MNEKCGELIFWFWNIWIFKPCWIAAAVSALWIWFFALGTREFGPYPKAFGPYPKWHFQVQLASKDYHRAGSIWNYANHPNKSKRPEKPKPKKSFETNHATYFCWMLTTIGLYPSVTLIWEFRRVLGTPVTGRLKGIMVGSGGFPQKVKGKTGGFER